MLAYNRSCLLVCLSVFYQWRSHEKHAIWAVFFTKQSSCNSLSYDDKSPRSTANASAYLIVNAALKNSLTNIFLCQVVTIYTLPVMAAVAVRKKVVSIGHFLPCFWLQSPKFFLFSVRSNQKQLYVLIALKIREK